MNNKLKAILFDLDGVIVDTAKFHYLAWKWLADREGIYFDEIINERLKGVSRMGSLEIILERSPRLYKEAEKLQLTEVKNDKYVRMIEDLTPTDTLPGVVEFLECLKSEGIKTAICSASKSAAYIIRKLKLSGYFDVIIGGNDVTKPKPDPEVFILAASKLGISHEDCVVFEDAFAGIEAAKSAGMKTLGLGKPEVLTNADCIFSGIDKVSLKEVNCLFTVANKN